MLIKSIKYTALIIFICVLLIITLFILGVIWPLNTIEPVVTKAPITIDNVSVIDAKTDSVKLNQQVVINNHRILYVGSVSEAPILDGAISINGQGKYLMPALWDMHAHVYKFMPLLDLPLFIGYGVTNVRDMTSCPRANDPIAPCPDDLERWSEAAINGELVAPRIQGISSWQANGPSIHRKIKGLPEFFGTATATQAREFVRFYEGKVDAIKVYNYIPRDAYFALVDEAQKLGMDVIGHRPHAVSAIEAAQNQKSIEHARFILHESFSGSAELRALAQIKGAWHEDRRRMLDEHDPEMANAIFTAMVKSDTYYVPTHLTRRVDAYGDDSLILEDQNRRYLHPLLRFQWLEDVNKVINEDPSPEARATYREFYHKGLELTGVAHSAGVKVLAGSDYIVAGATLHDELEQLVMAGLSPADAIKAATFTAAEYYGLEQKYGEVSAGMMADLILLNGNPLSDIRQTKNIDAVIFNGNLYDQNKLEQISDYVERQAKSWAVACKVIWSFLKSPVNY